ncbi:hypothetical protein [Candidatus Nitrotoga fabula]|uniref:Uncharacterized protein n=1 Tax=Candidatus Nitrotoga fabula TaxID=2182327 RepID=A0A916BEI8_9PROT|nr:hypothetical protein [Candidatus Nitrotoga fabula]CAE6688201.1 conserved membrane hypothetical protein [Candidatus Nitrotoga fabula]
MMKIFRGNPIRQWVWIAVHAIIFLSASSSASAEPATAASCPDKDLKLPTVMSVKSDRPATDAKQAAMGEKIIVELQGLTEAMRSPCFDPKQLVLYFDGYPLDGVFPDTIDPTRNELTFTPRRNEKNNGKWSSLIGSPGQFLRPVKVSVGLPDQFAFPVDPSSRIDANFNNFEFIVLRKDWFTGLVITFIVLISLFIWLAKNSNIIRDSKPPYPDPGREKPYSLAKFQASFWFILVVASFLFIWAVTGDHTSILTEQTLILIGIGIGTSLGSAMIDSSKQEGTDNELVGLLPQESKIAAELDINRSEIAKLEASTHAPAATGSVESMDLLRKLKIDTAQKAAELEEIRKKIANVRLELSNPISRGFIKDLLSDASGVNFHRFQMLVWTLVMGFIFCVEVYKTLRMPEFSTTLLALMGISAGTYLGFKIPEVQVQK